jgi:hypothetical protein
MEINANCKNFTYKTLYPTIIPTKIKIIVSEINPKNYLKLLKKYIKTKFDELNVELLLSCCFKQISS